MSSMDSKRSKRRRNKRGNAKAKQKVCNVNSAVGLTNVSPTANGNVEGNSFSQTHAQLTANLKKMPHSLPVSELDLDNIPQPLTQMPKSHNPYLDREHCLLCRRERPDTPRDIATLVGSKDNGDGQILNTPPMPLWLCPECRQNVEEEERNSKTFDSPSLPQDVFVSSNLPLISSTMDRSVDLSTGDGIISGGSKTTSEDPCSCVKCKEQRLIIAEEEKAKIKLAEYWSELSHMVRCVYLEAGTALADDSSTKLCLPRIAELVQRLCAHDPHQLFLRLEIEVEDFVKEVKERLLKRLGEGYRSPPLAKQFMTMLLEEYASLISASKTLSTVLDKLEEEHLSKFKLTWVLHNKHLFHSMVYLEPDLHNKLSQLLKYLQQGSQKESYHSEESFSKLCQRYLKFSDEMTDLSEGWREHQQLIESYVEKREINRTRELLAQQRTNWEFNFPPFPPPSDPKPHSSHCTHKEKSCSQNGDSKESGDHSQCSCKAKCLYQNNRIPHQNALYDNLDEGLIPPQLVSLDSYNYLQSIQPPNLSSLSSSQDDSEEVPIFSRRSCIDPGMCSPCSEDSIDSDDLTSESSQDVPSQDAGYEVDDESESCNYGKQRRNSGSEKLSNGSGSSKADSAYQSNQMCECHACITSAMQNAKLLPPASSVIGATTTDTSTTLTPSELRGQTSPYLFYPNLTNHQPLDLSHHGITAKHPLIHPHLYNLSSQQKPSSGSQPFQLVNGLSSEVNASYESAKMSLHSCGYDTDPDLLQSVKDALQTNCKLDKSGLLSSYARKSKQEEEAAAAAQKVCSSSQVLSRDSSVGLYNTAQFSVDAWARQQYMAQLQQNGTLGSSVTSTHTPDCCPKHAAAAQLPRVPGSAAGVKSHPYSHGITPTTAGSTTVGSSGLMQPISPLVRNLPVTDPEAYSTIKRAPLLNPNLGQLTQQPPHHQQLQHQSSCKKKKGTTEDLDRYHQPGCTMSCGMRTAEYNQEIHQQSVCALHNQPGISLSQGSAVDPVPSHNPGSTSTSASECSDPDCDTHNFNDDDLCGNSDDRSSSTTSSSRERDSKHCGCCYCEVFGHGGPALAPMSRNYPEMRDRLRLKLRERQQIPKDESPSHTHSSNPEQRRNTGIPLDDKKLDDIVKYITGDKPIKTKSSKAAKRQRQKQRKAEQRVKQENQAKNSHCPSKEQHPEKCQNLSTQSTPTKSNKFKTKLPAAEASHLPSPGSSVDKKDHKGLQDTPPSGKLKGPDKKKLKPTEAPSSTQNMSAPLPQQSTKPSHNPAKSTQNVAPSSQKSGTSSQKTTSAATSKSSSSKGDVPSEERRKEKRPKSATVDESIKEAIKTPSDKNDKKNETPTEKMTSVVKQGKKESGKNIQEVTSKAVSGKQKASASVVSKPNSTIPAKGANGMTTQASPNTSRKGKKDTSKKDVGVDDRKKPTQSGNTTAQQGKAEGNDQKSNPKTKDKGSEEGTKKQTPVAAKANNKKTETPLVNGHPESKNHVINKPSSKTSGKKTEVPVENGQGKNHLLNKPNSKTGNKKPETPLENGHRDSKDQAASKAKTTGKGNTKINGIIKGANSEVVSAVAPTNNNKKKKKKKGGEANTSIDDIFLPKEDVDMNKLDEVEQELEAFKRFCMDSTPQRKKEKVVFNVKDIILKKTPAN